MTISRHETARERAQRERCRALGDEQLAAPELDGPPTPRKPSPELYLAWSPVHLWPQGPGLIPTSRWFLDRLNGVPL